MASFQPKTRFEGRPELAGRNVEDGQKTSPKMRQKMEAAQKWKGWKCRTDQEKFKQVRLGRWWNV